MGAEITGLHLTKTLVFTQFSACCKKYIVFPCKSCTNTVNYSVLDIGAHQKKQQKSTKKCPKCTFDPQAPFLFMLGGFLAPSKRESCGALPGPAVTRSLSEPFRKRLWGHACEIGPRFAKPSRHCLTLLSELARINQPAWLCHAKTTPSQRQVQPTNTWCFELRTPNFAHAADLVKLLHDGVTTSLPPTCHPS